MRIGAGMVDFATREITMPEARDAARVTPKSIAVLRLLAQTPGEVLTRSELLARAWPDTLPGDDVLTQAVTQLRKAFGAGSVTAAEGRRYIETIAKTGYRLTVPVQVIDELPATTALAVDRVRVTDPAFAALEPAAGIASNARAADTPVARPQARWLLGVATVALLVGVVTGLFLVSVPGAGAGPRVEPMAGPGRPYRLITNAAGFELSPTLSPDASMVAYAAALTADGEDGAAILVQTTTSAAPRILSRPAPGDRDDLPAWSPDGREIAFSRRSGDGGCRVLLIAATGAGDEREIARCDGSDLLSFDWLPDGSGLLFGTLTGAADGGRMRVLNPVDGRWRALVYPAMPGDLDYAPKVSPDGRWIAFVRNPQMGDIWRVPVEGGEAEQLTRLGAEMRGLAWAPDSRGIVFGIRVDHESRLYMLDSETGTFADLGIEDAQTPAVSAQTGMLAFVHRRPHFGIRRIDAASGEDAPMFASSGRDTQPTLSPDGQQLAFTSDRAGRFELWWADLRRADSLRPIEGVRPDTRQAPVWSPDGRRLLVSVLDDSGAASIMEIEPSTGHAMPLPVPGNRPMQAAYAADGRLLVIEEDRHGRAALVAYAREGWQVLGRIDGVSQVRFDPRHGRVLYTRLDGNGLWSADADLTPASVRQLSDTLPSRWRYRMWSVDPDGRLSYLDGDPGCRTRLTFFDVGPDALEPDAMHCISKTHRSATNGYSTATGGWAVSIASEDGTDIGFMPLPGVRHTDEVVAKWLLSIRKKVS
ncbi:winged helix-turn-helix domain-containing protein [Luteimonas sp. WGS1318]|uniref:winged helix-turn-helix domain-containing protein n=1 Tax=Luteimonas sp. WGS1318 TaxID=3366815 RepID=UPI00372D785B